MSQAVHANVSTCQSFGCLRPGLRERSAVEVVADGCGGKIVTHMNKDYISGGGAGGAIIMPPGQRNITHSGWRCRLL